MSDYTSCPMHLRFPVFLKCDHPGDLIPQPRNLLHNDIPEDLHVLAGKLYKIAGIVSCAGALVPDRAIWFILVPVLASTLATVVYSYALRNEREQSWKTNRCIFLSGDLLSFRGFAANPP